MWARSPLFGGRLRRRAAPRMSSLEPERRRVLAVLRRHGWNATSFQVLEPGFRYWFADADACVAYVDTGRAWIAAGAPLTGPGRLRAVAEEFHRHALESGRRAAFFAVEQRVVDALPWHALLIGEQPEWEAQGWSAALRASSGLREQLRRARAKGVTVRTAAHDELVSSRGGRSAEESRRWWPSGSPGTEWPRWVSWSRWNPLTLLKERPRAPRRAGRPRRGGSSPRHQSRPARGGCSRTSSARRPRPMAPPSCWWTTPCGMRARGRGARPRRW